MAKIILVHPKFKKYFCNIAITVLLHFCVRFSTFLLLLSLHSFTFKPSNCNRESKEKILPFRVRKSEICHFFHKWINQEISKEIKLKMKQRRLKEITLEILIKKTLTLILQCYKYWIWTIEQLQNYIVFWVQQYHFCNGNL